MYLQNSPLAITTYPTSYVPRQMLSSPRHLKSILGRQRTHSVMKSIQCDCGKMFKNEKALADHRRDSSKHQGVPSADSGQPGMEVLVS